MRRLLPLLALLLAGCASAPDIVLQNAAGRTLVCPGGSAWTPTQGIALAAAQRGCVQDYQRQGYERVRP